MKGGSRRRPEQVGEIVRQVLAEAIAREVRDPRIGFITVTRVVVSGDLSHADVYVMAQGEEPERLKAIEGLKSAAGFLRGRFVFFHFVIHFLEFQNDDYQSGLSFGLHSD